MRYLILVFLFACTSSTKEVKTVDVVKDLHAEDHTQVEQKKTEDLTKVIEEGPTDIEISKYDPPPPPSPENPKPEPVLREKVKIHKGGKKTSETDAKTDEVKKTDDKKNNEEVKAHVDDKKEHEYHPAASCAFGGYLWALALLAVAFLGFKILGRFNRP